MSDPTPAPDPERDYVRALFRPPEPVPEVDEDGNPVDPLRLFARRLFTQAGQE